MIRVQPRYLSLTELLERKLFRIPDYQRAYSWTHRQRKDLFDDIGKVDAKGRKDGHFMAAIVCLTKERQSLGIDEFDVMEIVDGQQRLTTLIMLLNSIKLALNQKKSKEAKLASDLQDLLVKPDADELLLLQTNHDTSHYFSSWLRKGTAPPSKAAQTLADREILEAIEDCQNFVSNWQDDGKPVATLLALLKNRLFFLLHEINEEKTVYTVFEVLNSRGLEVSWFDRLKSILMGKAFELKMVDHNRLIKDLHVIWRDIYRVIGLHQGLSTEALRFSATLRYDRLPSRPLGEAESVEVLREIAKDAKSIREVADWVLRVTEACELINKDVRINAVTRISQARLLATAIYLRKGIHRRDRDKLLHRWEKVSFRIYGMLGNDARTRVGDYTRLSWQVVNENLSVNRINKSIGEIGKEFTVAQAINELKNRNCYEGWEVELRYFLYRYEEHLANEWSLKFSNEQWNKIWMVSAAQSIEHIWPQSKAPEKHRHRLGNLLLLPPGLNSKLQAKRPKAKTQDYRRTGLLIAEEVADEIETTGWGRKAIGQRENDLLEWAESEWAD